MRSVSRLPSPASSVRFASTAQAQSSGPSTISVAESNITTNHDPVAAANAPFIEDPLSNASEIIASVTQPQIEPHYGFLKELGIDFGWGTTALVQWSVEHIHVLLGTPWWATIVISIVAFRAALFRIYVGAADNSARIATAQLHLKDVQARIDKAKQTRDMNAMMQGTQELRNAYAAAGIKMWKNFLPFIQLPLGFGMFRLARGMATLPVPGLEHGGILWFHDLTVSDPTFLLPITTGLASFYLFRLGGEVAATNPVFPSGLMTAMKWGLPILSTLFTAFWPAAMQLVFSITSIVALLQSLAFRQPGLRRLLGIHPLPSPTAGGPLNRTRDMVIDTTARTKPKTPDGLGQRFVSSAKSRMRKFVEKNQGSPSVGRSKGQMAEAQRYEEKRRKELEREKFEAEQERHRKRFERRTR